MPLYVLSRHAHSELNLAHRINGDPSVPVGLTEQGREEAARLGKQLANVPIELIVHTRFSRTRETPRIARETARRCRSRKSRCWTTSTSASWRGRRSTSTAPGRPSTRVATASPAARASTSRHAGTRRGFRKLAERREEHILVVCHEIPIRYALNAALGSEDSMRPVRAVPNATPFLFEEDALVRAAARIEELAG